MWEYLARKINPHRDRTESSSVHPATPPSQMQHGKEVQARTEPDSGVTPHKKESRARPKAHRLLYCPVCNIPMDIQYIGKIQVDQCPQCNGVFLDRGELKALRAASLSTYKIDRTKREDDEFLIYTPDGLSDHLRGPHHS